MGNTEAWALEAADNYISVWGWAFTTDCDLNLQLCAPTGAVVFQSPCSYVSQNELRAEIGQLPPSGSFEVRLAPSQGDVLPSNTWSFGDDLHLAVVQLKSFFPLFGQANPIEPETLSITTDASSLNSLQPLCRWKARATPYDLKQDVVSLNGEHLLCTVPKVTLDPKFPIASDSFDVLCSVDSHSIRQYGPPDSNSYTMVKQPIWRLVDTLHQFRFVDVQSISPSFCGTSGGEPITITFSADIRSSTATGQSLAVFFGDQPGYDAAWVSGNSISVNTPILSANPGLTLKVMVDQEPFTFVGFSVYELTSVSPSYGIQGSQALHAFGKYLPPGRKGKIFLSAQTRTAPVANPVPSLPAIQASVLSAIAAAQAADRAVADNAVQISATTKAFQEAQLRLGRAQAQKSQVDAASQDPLIAKTLATLQSQVVAELTAAQAESFSVSRTLTELQRNQVSLIATAKAAHDTLTKAEASQETTDSQTAAASNAATISQSHIVLPSFLQTTSTVSTIPTPTVADFWFYLPRGISPTESYDIWYCPDGNTVPTLLPNAFRPFVITSIGPLAASITANQTITINGVFPAELQSQVLNVRFLNDTDQSVYVDCPATWTSPSVLSVVLKANSFAQVCDLVIQVSVQGDRSAHYVLDSGTTTRSLISLYRLSSLINTLIPT
ncbi:hypothetical protein SISNIDRAFT_136688 [Sistotremastrum niveocremeum HHB9708]|uniref:Uncharacterized protein n=1 Tax=Sistotremastrum niveocremeum HHB9708 TaxID=1314777 RepID=A0A164ZZ31_9AGAM|nr:hypothetical protein SISNIDRAFT_136688 [Sistotremastrum niveocremeum HHB9708]